MKMPVHNHSQTGFTIVELMVATMVFSTIMLVITFGVMQFSRAYYRGITTSTLQNTARTTVDTITQSLQFSGTSLVSAGPVTASDGITYSTYCIGGNQFDYVLHSQMGDSNTGLASGQIPHALYVTPSLAGGACSHANFFVSTSSDSSNNSRELLAPNMRLVKFDITPVKTDLYRVDLRLAYGAAALLCSPSLSGSGTVGSCDNPADPTDYGYLQQSDLICKATNGSQFCAVSELSTIVQKRVQ